MTNIRVHHLVPGVRAIFSRVVVSIFALLLAACSGGGGGDGDDDVASFPEGTTGTQLLEQADLAARQRLVDHMLDRYLWFSELPALDLADESYANLRVLLNGLRKQPEDRFSAILDAASFGNRVERGLSQSFGLRFFIREESPLDLRIALVDDFGTAGLAGIQRGDRVIAAQGTPIDELGVEGFVSIFEEPGLGVSRDLLIRHPDGREVEYTITRTEHSLNPVRKATVFELDDIDLRVAYVQVTEFIELTQQGMEDMRNLFANSRIDEVILDLRYNGGGLVSASRDLASSFYGQSLSSDIYTVLQRNDLHRDEDFVYRYRQFDNALASLTRIFILTTRSTCSASEEVINGLIPFMEVITVGETTCGKPYAARPFPLISNLVLANVLESRSINADGVGDFYEGLPATCNAADDPTLPFDDENESLVAVALNYIRNGSCPQIQSDDPGLVTSQSKLSGLRMQIDALPAAIAISD